LILVLLLLVSIIYAQIPKGSTSTCNSGQLSCEQLSVSQCLTRQTADCGVCVTGEFGPACKTVGFIPAVTVLGDFPPPTSFTPKQAVSKKQLNEGTYSPKIQTLPECNETYTGEAGIDYLRTYLISLPSLVLTVKDCTPRCPLDLQLVLATAVSALPSFVNNDPAIEVNPTQFSITTFQTYCTVTDVGSLTATISVTGLYSERILEALADVARTNTIPGVLAGRVMSFQIENTNPPNQTSVAKGIHPAVVAGIIVAGVFALLLIFAVIGFIFYLRSNEQSEPFANAGSS